LTDHQGSVRVLLDNQGNVVNNITYDAFGNITLETHSQVNFRFSYTVRELDSETGLYNYRARYYDPESGRFISEDPIGFEAGDSNVYRYVGNSPLFYVDPSGFCGVSSSGGTEFGGLGDFAGFTPGSFGVGGFGGFGGFGTVDGGGAGGAGFERFFEPDDTVIAQSIFDELGGWVGSKLWEGAVIFGTGVVVFTGKILNGISDGVADLIDSLENSPITISPITTLDPKEFDPNNINLGTYKPEVDPFNVETFPRNPDDFLKGDTFTFPGGGNTNIRDYVETFPKDIDYWLESPIFETNYGDNGKNARELRRNIIEAGIIFNPHDEAHHIIPSLDGRIQVAKDLRQTLEDFNIDINDSVNGVPLTNSQHHGNGLHSKKNYEEINRRLEEASSEAEARARVFVSQEFKDCVEKNNLEGLIFREIYSE
jgi:RHS repeat-associated protein